MYETKQYWRKHWTDAKKPAKLRDNSFTKKLRAGADELVGPDDSKILHVQFANVDANESNKPDPKLVKLAGQLQKSNVEYRKIAKDNRSTQVFKAVNTDSSQGMRPDGEDDRPGVSRSED